MRRNSGGRGSFVLDAGAGALGPVIAGRGRGRGHFPRVRASLFFFPHLKIFRRFFFFFAHLKIFPPR